MNNKNNSGIYCIENIISSKKYIGQSKCINERWKNHISELNLGHHHNSYLQNSWNKYGEKGFKFYVLEFCSNDKLNEKERYYIDYYNTLDRNYGYNLKSGGQDTNYLTIEVKEKLSSSIRNSYLNSNLKEKRKSDALIQWSDPAIKEKITGKNNGMYGKNHSKEAKEKISKALKGRPSPKRNTTPVICIELDRIFKDATIASNELSIDSSSILKVCRGERKCAGGYSWEFKQ